MTKPQMTMDEARRILKSIIKPKGSGLLGDLVSLEGGSCGDVAWHPTDFMATLDGDFSADELEAIAVYMRDNADGTRD